MKIAALLLLLPIGLRAAGEFAPIVEGTRYVYQFEYNSYGALSTIQFALTETGTDSIAILDVKKGGDSTWFTIQVRESRHSIDRCSPACSSEGDDTVSFSRRFLVRRDTFYQYKDSTPTTKPVLNPVEGSIDPREYPMMAYSAPYKKIQIDPFTGKNYGPVNAQSKLNDSILKVDFFEGAEGDTTYFLKGVGSIFSKHADVFDFHSFQERYQLISYNGRPFRLEDHLHVDHPLAVGSHASIRREGPVKGMGAERWADPLGRRRDREAVPAMPLFLLR